MKVSSTIAIKMLQEEVPCEFVGALLMCSDEGILDLMSIWDEAQTVIARTEALDDLLELLEDIERVKGTKVWVVTPYGHGSCQYGLYGVYSKKEDAEKRAAELALTHKYDIVGIFDVEEWGVEDTYDE